MISAEQWSSLVDQIDTARNLQVFARAAQEQRTQVQLPEGYVRYSAAGLFKVKHLSLFSIITPMTLVTSIHIVNVFSCGCRYETMIVLRPDMSDENRQVVKPH